MRVLMLSLMLVAGCGGDEEDHEDGEFRCTDEVLEEYHADEAEWHEEEDCAADGLVCDAEMGMCMAEE